MTGSIAEDLEFARGVLALAVWIGDEESAGWASAEIARLTESKQTLTEVAAERTDLVRSWTRAGRGVARG